MTKPTDDIAFATDATYGGADPWSGDPTKVNPGGSRTEEGYEPDLLPAEWLNWQLNLIGRHILYIHDVLEGADTPTQSASPLTRKKVLPGVAMIGQTSVAADNPPYASANVLVFDDTTDKQIGVLDLRAYVPAGATDVQIKVLITPGTHSSAGVAEVFYREPNFSTPAAGTLTSIDNASTSGTSLQVLTLDIPGPIEDDRFYLLTYVTGDLTSGQDDLAAIQITWEDPGRSGA